MPQVLQIWNTEMKVQIAHAAQTPDSWIQWSFYWSVSSWPFSPSKNEPCFTLIHCLGAMIWINIWSTHPILGHSDRNSKMIQIAWWVTSFTLNLPLGLCIWKLKLLVAQLCLTLCNPMNCSPPGSSVHGIFQARILEWVASPSPGKSSRLRDQTWVSCMAGGFFTCVQVTLDYLSIKIFCKRLMMSSCRSWLELDVWERLHPCFRNKSTRN